MDDVKSLTPAAFHSGCQAFLVKQNRSLCASEPGGQVHQPILTVRKVCCCRRLFYNSEEKIHKRCKKMSWKLKHFNELTTTELYAILKERTAVFVVEQECPYMEVDGKDLHSYHLYKEENGEVAAYARILPKGVSYDEASIGRVMVKKEYRGRGLAGELMTRSLDFIHGELKEAEVKIQAQEYLREFYESFGFRAITETYLDDGIPHIDMVLGK
jgi:ElaA protein